MVARKDCKPWLKALIGIVSVLVYVPAIAAEVPLCALPSNSTNNDAINAEPNPNCQDVIKQANILANSVAKSHPNNAKYIVPLVNKFSTPPHIKVGSVYLQPVTMAPNGMMRPSNISDIHLEIDIHAQDNLKSSGFSPGDWLPNAKVTYSIQKIGESVLVPCGFDMISHKPTSETTCELMPMVASDGAHYGDNVKLGAPGFYIVTFNAASNPHGFGWHTDKDSKILTTAYVDWKFTQSYLFKWTGIGKKGGY